MFSLPKNNRLPPKEQSTDPRTRNSDSRRCPAARRTRRGRTDTLALLLFSAVLIALFHKPLRELFLLAWHSQYDSYILFVPCITAYLLYQKRTGISDESKPPSLLGIVIAGAALLLLFLTKQAAADSGPRDYLTLVMFPLVMLWIGAYIILQGTGALREAAFPLLFLFFLVPVPAGIMERLTLFLQTGSAETAHLLFRASGIPAAKEGFIFHLPGLDIEVARECSGIRSAIALLLTGLLASALLLRTAWARTVFMLSIIPLALLKNALRIVVLSVLGAYVDKSFLTHSVLHSRGGILFFALALALAGTVLLMLRRLESARAIDRH